MINVSVKDRLNFVKALEQEAKKAHEKFSEPGILAVDMSTHLSVLNNWMITNSRKLYVNKKK